MSSRFKMLAGAAFGALLLSLAAGSALAQALDTTELPRVNVTKQLYVNPVTTMYITGDSVMSAAESIADLLAGKGWQRYQIALSASADDASMQNLYLKKGSQLLSVFIRAAPAHGNATAVQYSELPLPNDLPFPPGASDIQFDPNRPYLTAFTAASLTGTLTFFTEELGRLGFEPWPENRPGTDKEVAAFFLRQGKQPLLVTLQRSDDDRTRIKVESVSPKLLSVVAQRTRDETAKPAAPQLSAPAPRAPAAPSEIDRIIESTMKDALPIARDATKAPLARPSAQQAPAETLRAETLRALTGGSMPIPVPDTAAGVEHDAQDGTLEFTSPSSVASVAGFYRTSMKAAGFSERPSVINRANMAVLTFVKQSKTVTLTVMQMGSDTNVRASGSALVTHAVKTTTAKREAPADAPGAQTNAAPQELEAGEMGGLPVPTRSTQKGTERTRYRIALNASVPADLASVLAFYRRELGKRDWKEEASGGNPVEASVRFTSPEGPAILTLARKGDDTIVKLTQRKPGEAEKAGLLPKPGQAKLVMGNVLDTETTITINKRTIKVGAQVGARQPDGPMLDLKPGKYTFSFRSAGQPPRTDEVTVAAGETWGILIGPGGALPLQAY